MTDMDELWRDLVRKHTTGGACNFREAAFAFADEAVRNEREACARKADEAESVCTDAALAHPVDSAEGIAARAGPERPRRSPPRYVLDQRGRMKPYGGTTS